MKEGMDKRKDEWSDGKNKGWVKGWKKERMNEKLRIVLTNYERKDEWRDGKKNEWMKGWKKEQTNERRDEKLHIVLTSITWGSTLVYLNLFRRENARNFHYLGLNDKRKNEWMKGRKEERPRIVLRQSGVRI